MAISTFYKICENVGIDTGFCLSMCKCMSLYESCYCIKSIQTLQIITIDAFVTKEFPFLLQYARNFLSFMVQCTWVKRQ